MKSVAKVKTKRPRAVIVHSEPKPSTSKKNPYITELLDNINLLRGSPSFTDLSSSDFDDVDEGFRPAKKVKAPKPVTASVPLAIRNRFSTLSEPTSDTVLPTTLKDAVPPPVFIKGLPSWKNLSNTIKLAKITFKSARVVDDTIRVQPTTTADYRALQALLLDRDIEFYSFRLKTERPIQAVIRGLPPSVTCDEVVEELKLMNNPVQSAYRIGKTRSLVVVHLDRSEEARRIYDLSDLLYLKVKVESKRRSQLPGQCHRCQNFGHSSFRCHLQWRCVRCGENHATADCDRKSPETFHPKCANCQGEHTANFRGCSAYQSATIRKQANKPQSAVSANKTFADVVRGSHPLPSASTNVAFPSSSSGPKPVNSASCPSTNNQPIFDWFLNLIKNLNISSICNSVKTFLVNLPLPPYLINILQLALDAIPSLFSIAINSLSR